MASASLVFINDMLAHIQSLTYTQIGMFVLVVFLLYFVEHLIHYNAMLYGMVAVPGITAATSAAANAATATATATAPPHKKKRTR